MTTNTPNKSERPSDEMTAAVVAKQCEKVDEAYGPYGPQVDMYSKFWIENGCVYASTRDHPDKSDFYSDDPRDDTDVALELMGWLQENNHVDVEMDVYRSPAEPLIDGPCFGANTDSGLFMLPISGQPFRYAVVRLAHKLMIGESND